MGGLAEHTFLFEACFFVKAYGGGISAEHMEVHTMQVQIIKGKL